MTLDETRERLVRLETKFEHMSETLDETRRTVNEMRDLLQQARGARWVIAGLAGLGGFAASFAFKFLPFWR